MWSESKPTSAFANEVIHFAQSTGLEKASCAETCINAGNKYQILVTIASLEFHIVITSKIGTRYEVIASSHARFRSDFRFGEAINGTT